MGSSQVIPDFDWYVAISAKHGGTPRCPFAFVERCPRYYQSLSLLSHAGSTSIDPTEDERLLNYWKKSDMWPKTAEYETAIAGPDGRISLFDNFCPEVTFDRFRYFAVYLHRYTDDIDADVATERLAREGAPANDPRWNWDYVKPMHYTECPLYSPLLGGSGERSTAKTPEHEVSLSFCGAAIKLQNPLDLAHRLCDWLSMQWAKPRVHRH